jgi:hypothetical protein|tara:strand:+ start:485 stop:637 length:153 start_codon:yes stop_codon:yes gene_type:complete
LLASPEKIALERLILAARQKKTIGCTEIPALPLAEKANKSPTLPGFSGSD